VKRLPILSLYAAILAWAISLYAGIPPRLMDEMLIISQPSAESSVPITMTENVLVSNILVTITPTGSGYPTNPWLYTLNGTLTMANYNFYSSDPSSDFRNLTLNMGGNALFGTQTATNFNLSVPITASRWPQNLTITNVGSIQIGKVWTYYGNADGWYEPAGSVTIGANVNGQRAGNVEIAEILAYHRYILSSLTSEGVEIYSSGNVSIWNGSVDGDISTYITRGDSPSGPITVKHHGAFRARNLDTYNSGLRSESIILDGDITATGIIGSMACSLIQTYVSGGGQFYAGSVTVTNYMQVSIANGIYAYSGYADIYNWVSGGGTVNVSCASNILIGTVNTYSLGAYSGGGKSASPITLSTSGGNITITNTLDSHGVQGDGANIIVSAGAGNIAVSNALTSSSVSGTAGNIRVNALGNILMGSMNLDGSTNSTEGVLSITNTASTATITVSLLDIAKCKNAYFSAGSGTNYITALLNFNTTSPTNGEITAAGGTVFYDSANTNNAYLATNNYTLSSGSLKPGVP